MGVADHRGEVVPIVDLRRRFQLPPLADDAKAKWIMLDLDGRWVGLAVDQVTEVFGTVASKFGPPPKMGEGDAKRGILGVVHHDGGLIFVLDVTAIEVVAMPMDASELAVLQGET